MEVDYIVEQNTTLQEMQHQKNMAMARLCAEYDERLVRMSGSTKMFKKNMT